MAHLRNAESNPVNYRAAVSGFLAEIDRMQLEVREYLSFHPRELALTVQLGVQPDGLEMVSFLASLGAGALVKFALAS